MNRTTTRIFAPVRCSPPHKGHIKMFLWYLSKYTELIIGIGSSCENGKSRHPLLSFIREIMLAKSLINEGVDMHRVKFVHLQDFRDSKDDDVNFIKWWNHITGIPGFDTVTHFGTGNVDDILLPLKKLGIKTSLKFINPETEMPPEYQFPYHSTNLRNVFKKGTKEEGDYELFDMVAASGTKEFIGNWGDFQTMRDASEDKGKQIVPGRQSVDMVVTGYDGDVLKVLCGYRKKDKADFPGALALPGGGIDDYENPMLAALRELFEETNFSLDVKNMYVYPTHVAVDKFLTVLKFVDLFSSTDPKLGGSKGGSSQVFHVNIGQISNFKGKLKSKSDLEKVAFRSVKHVLRKKLAYQQTDMLKAALKTL